MSLLNKGQRRHKSHRRRRQRQQRAFNPHHSKGIFVDELGTETTVHRFPSAQLNGSIRCRESLGGLLRFYHRQAA